MVTWCRFNFNCASVPLIRTHTNFPLALAHRHQHHHHRRRRCTMVDIDSYWIKVIFVSTQLWPLVTHFSCSAFHYISLYCMIIFRQNQLDFGSCRSLFRVATNKTLKCCAKLCGAWVLLHKMQKPKWRARECLVAIFSVVSHTSADMRLCIFPKWTK